MICPRCGGNDCQYVDRVMQKTSLSKACCGWVACGPLCGLLMGINGKTEENQYWVCHSCGNKFKSKRGMATNLVKSQEEALLSEAEAEKVRLEQEKIDRMNNKEVPFLFCADLGEDGERDANEFVYLKHLEEYKGEIEYLYQDKIIFGIGSPMYDKTNGLMYKIANITSSLKKGEHIAFIICYDDFYMDGMVVTNKMIYLHGERIVTESIRFITAYGIYTDKGVYMLDNVLEDDLVILMRYLCLNKQLVDETSIKEVTSTINYGVDRLLDLKGVYLNDSELVYFDSVISGDKDWSNFVYTKQGLYFKKPVVGKGVVLDNLPESLKQSSVVGSLSQATAIVKKKAGLSVDHYIMKVTEDGDVIYLSTLLNFVRDFQIVDDKLYIRRSDIDSRRNNLVCVDLDGTGEVVDIVTKSVSAYTATDDGLYYCTKTGNAMSGYALYHLVNDYSEVYCELDCGLDNLKYDGEYFYSIIGEGLYQFNAIESMNCLVQGLTAFDVSGDTVYFTNEKGVYELKKGDNPKFLYPVDGVTDLYVYNGLLYLYQNSKLVQVRVDGLFEVDEML